ncbi:YhgE/Pip family protein [Weissella viridescens]|uniref:YhgE/Pip family protein n=1 Tax=Weissella viridescens TaxID=1629 RepID=UPI003AA96626
MIKAEWEKLKKNKLLRFAMIVIMLIPAIYSVIFLKSMWNPYGALDKLPVAVVNQDQSVKIDGKKVNIGKSMANNLVDSKSLDFKKVDEKEADKKLKDGKYYLEIIIPKDFSKNSKTLMDDHPKQMQLKYKTSSGNNFIGSKIGEGAMNEIKADVQSEVTKAYAQAVLTGFKQAGKGMQKAADGSAKLGDGLQKASDGSKSLADGAGKLGNGAGQLGQGLGQYTNGVSQLNDGSQKLAGGLSELNSKGGQLQSGAGSLAGGLGQYTGGVSKLNQGGQSLATGLGQYTGGVSKLVDGSSQLNEGIQQYTAGVSSAQAGSAKLTDSLNTLNSSVNDGGQSLSSAASQYKTEVDKLRQTQSGGNNAALTAKLSDMAGQIQSLAALENASNLTAAQKQTLKTNVSGLTANLNSVQTELQSDSAQTNNLAKLADGYDQLYAGMQKAFGGVSELSAGANSLNGGLSQLNQKSAGLKQGGAAVYNGLTQLDNKSGEIQSGANQLAGGLGQLNGKSGEIQSGANQLAGGLGQLDGKSGEIQSGANQIAGGLGQLDSKSGQLQSGANQLASGLGQYTGGVSQLNQGGQQLASGLGQLDAKGAQIYEAAEQLAAGGGKLTAGANELTVGLVSANQGADKLSKGLNDGAEKVNKVKDNKKTVNMFGKPIKVKHSDSTNTKNNGYGMAPYMLSIYLYVGMITLMAIINVFDPAIVPPKSSLGWWFSKFMVPLVLSIGSALIVYLASIFLVGIHPLEPFKFLIVLLVSSVADMTILFLLSVCLGKLGTFLALILMVLQLSAAGGTYPMQLTTPFYRAIHPYMPMTYSIEGLRATISTGDGILQPMLILIAMSLVLAGLSYLFFRMQMKKRFRFDLQDEA